MRKDPQVSSSRERSKLRKRPAFKQTLDMLSKLAKPLAVKTSSWKYVLPLAKARGEISTFWYKPRVDVPGPAAANPRNKFNTVGNSTSSNSHHNPDFKCDCAFQKPITVEFFLYLMLVGGGTLGFLQVVDTCGRKYHLLSQVKQEWDEKLGHEESMPNIEMKRESLHIFIAQDYKK